jgi:hypothetical protein
MELKLPKMHEGTKPFCLGAAVGALLFTWMGFDLLGWKTESAANALAQKQADTAVIASHASICGAQAKASPNFAAYLAALEKTDRWSRGDVLTKTGFATMSGSKEAAPGVAQACADLLVPEKF